MFIKRERRSRISRTDKHNGASIPVVRTEIINQPFAVSLALESGINGYAFDFINTFSFTCHYSDCLQAVIMESKHFTPFQIGVYHALLLIRQQQQIQELFLVRSNPFYFHVAQYANTIFMVFPPRFRMRCLT